MILTEGCNWITHVRKRNIWMLHHRKKWHFLKSRSHSSLHPFSNVSTHMLITTIIFRLRRHWTFHITNASCSLHNYSLLSSKTTNTSGRSMNSKTAGYPRSRLSTPNPPGGRPRTKKNQAGPPASMPADGCILFKTAWLQKNKRVAKKQAGPTCHRRFSRF